MIPRTFTTRGRNHWHSDGRPAGWGQPLERARSRRADRMMGRAGIALAAFVTLYFLAQLVRWVLA